MTAIQPQTKSFDLIEKLNQLNLHFNELELRRVIAEANKLKAVEPATAYMILGMAESMRGSEEASISAFNASIALDKDPLIAANRSKAYSRFYRLSEALDIAYSSYQRNKGDAVILETTIDAAWRSGKIDLFFTLLKAWKSMYPDQTDKFSHEASILSNIQSPLREDFESLCTLVEGVLRANHAYGIDWALNQKNTGPLYFINGIRAEPLAIANMNLAIADAMSVLENNYSDKVIFLCRPDR